MSDQLCSGEPDAPLVDTTSHEQDSMTVLTFIPCRRLSTMLCACTRLKNLLFLAPVLFIGTWIFARNTASPLGSEVKRFPSALNKRPSYIYSFEDYSTNVDDNNIDDNNVDDEKVSFSLDEDREQQLSKTRSGESSKDLNTITGLADYRDPSLGFDPRIIRFREAPFAVEKTLDLDVAEQNAQDVPQARNLNPDDQSEFMKEDKVPEGIWRMFEDNDDGDGDDRKNGAQDVSSGLKKPSPLVKPPLVLKTDSIKNKSRSDSYQHSANNKHATRMPSQTRPAKPAPSSPNHLVTQKESGDKPTHPDKDAVSITANQKVKTELAAWQNVVRHRQEQMEEVCEVHSKHLKHRTVTDINSIVNEKFKLLYCPVEKAASTFMRRFMFALEHEIKDGQAAAALKPGSIASILQQNQEFANTKPRIPSPFHVPIQEALKHGFQKARALVNKGENPMSDAFVRLIIVREPFSRLFSAYEDKLIVPNSYYWKQWGSRIVAKFRPYPSYESVRCGGDVTFPEFVKFVIAETEKLLRAPDSHFRSTTSLCFPCDLHYNVIAHVETLREDFEYLTRSVLGVIVTNFSFNNLVEDVKTDAIADTVYSAFQFQKPLTSCVGKLEMGKRVWRKLQLRGIISNELYFRLTAEQMEAITPDDFIKECQKARENWRSRDREKMKKQKFSSMQEEFAKVPAEDIRKFVKLYATDFEMFGYNKLSTFLIEPDQW